MAALWSRGPQECAVVVGGLEADESVVVEPEGLLWEGQISHRRDGRGVVRGDLEDSSLSKWAEGDVAY